MKIILYVFSGTGNTKKIAKLYKSEFENVNAEVEIYPITNDNSKLPKPIDYDIIGIGYPVHAFNAPEVVINFIKSFETQNNKPYFVFKTSGEPLWLNDCSSQQLIKILNKKRFLFLQEHHYIMPYNMIYKHSDELASLMYHYAKRLVKLNSKKTLEKTVEKWKLPLYKTFYMPLMRVEWGFAKFNGKKFKVDYEKCTKCSLCVKVCQMENIVEENKKYCFGKNCALCGGCYFLCPSNAIDIGWLKGWKVNGKYKFSELVDEEAENIEAFNLKKMYTKYFKNLKEILDKDSCNKIVIN